MRLGRFLLGLLPFTLPLTLFGACADNHVALGVIMRAPNGVLDGATAVEVRVISADLASCNSGNGQVTGTTEGDDVLTFNMQQENCAGGAAWCKEISLDQDGAQRVFYVLATAGGSPLAQGCATAAVDRDPLEVNITMARFLPPRCCGNGVLEPSEQCDSGALAQADCAGNPPGANNAQCIGIVPDEVCECDCLAREILLSSENSDNTPQMNNEPGTKSELAMAFAGGGGGLGIGLRTVFTDRSTSASSTPDINVRYLASNLGSFDGSAQLNKQLRLPNCSNVINQTGVPRSQKEAAIAQVSPEFAGVVFAGDQNQVNNYDIYVNKQTSAGCANAGDTIKVNTSQLASAEGPDIAAGPAGRGLIAWNDSGNMFGRIWQDDGTFVPVGDIELGQMAVATRTHVAGNTSGWVVGYQSGGNNIFYRTVATDGIVGPEVQVNLVTEGIQSEVDIAMLPDGRFALVWNNEGAIVFQRYSAQGAAVAGDQDLPVNETGGAGFQPTIVGAAEAGNFFALAWAGVDGGVWSRFATGDGAFLFNSVTGQNRDFLASHPAVLGTRSHPAIAVGGDGYVAIGWQDDSAGHPGLYVRRFPLPLSL